MRIVHKSPHLPEDASYSDYWEYPPDERQDDLRPAKGVFGWFAKSVLFVSVAMLCFMVYAAYAEPLVRGTTYPVQGAILCDSEQEVKEVLTAMQESHQVGRVVLQKYMHIPSPYGGPVCTALNVPVLITIVKEVGHVEDVNLPNGDKVEAYIIAVLYNGKKGKTPGFMTSIYPVVTEDAGA